MSDAGDRAKAFAAEAGARRVRPGSLLALGSGTTAAFAIRALAKRFPAEGPIDSVASSVESERLAASLGLPVRALRGSDRFDLMLDGADEVAPDLSLTKGGGGALFREKLLARRSRELWVLVDPSKLVDRLGVARPIPIEVVPYSREVVVHRLVEEGAVPTLRKSPDGGTYRSDNGNEILDVRFPEGLPDPGATEASLRAIPGVVESGIFVGLASGVLIGHPDGRVDERTAAASPPGRGPSPRRVT